VPPRKGRRAARSVLVRRWLAVGALLLVALLYYRPLKAYVDARGQLGRHSAVVQKLETDKSHLERQLRSAQRLLAAVLAQGDAIRRRDAAGVARVDVAREAGTGSAGARLRASRGAAVHRQGHPAVAEAPTGQHDGPPWTLTQTAPSSLARSDVSRARFAESSCAVRSVGRR